MEQLTALSSDAYEAAFHYLETALAPRIKVELTARNSSVARLRTPDKATTEVHLLPWRDQPSAKNARRARLNIIWILIGRDRELREELRAAGQSYVDPGGAVRIELPGILVDRTDLDPVDIFAQTDSATDPFADRSSLVVRVLLSNNIRRDWGIRELAQTAGVGLGTASRVARQLDRFNLVEGDIAHGKPGRVRVTDPERLLDRWTRSYEWTRNDSLAVHAPMGDPKFFVTHRLSDLAFRDRQWALTLQSGAAFVARHASWERVHMYVDVTNGRELANLAAANRWSPGDDGRLVLLRPFYRTSIWMSTQQPTERVRVVSNLQLFLDLWNYPLRGREQAEIIRDRLLRPIWNG